MRTLYADLDSGSGRKPWLATKRHKTGFDQKSVDVLMDARNGLEYLMPNTAVEARQWTHFEPPELDETATLQGKAKPDRSSPYCEFGQCFGHVT